MLSVYIDVQDRGNVAIFNPFYIDSEKPLSLYVSFFMIIIDIRYHIKNIKTIKRFPLRCEEILNPTVKNFDIKQ